LINRSTKLITAPLITLLFVFSLQFCSSQKENLDAANIAETFESGMTFLEKENYLKAEETFTFIIYNDPGGAFADDAQFQLAETYFARDDFLLAISEYDRLLRRMKNSSYVEDAFWRKTEAYCELSTDYRLERDMTDKALRYLYDFKEIHPDSKYIPDANERIIEMKEKLAKKELETAKLYTTLHEYESAVYYYDSVIDQYMDTKLYASARLGKAEAMVALEKWEEARELMNSIAIDGKGDLSPIEFARLKSLGNKVVEMMKTKTD